MWGFNWKSAVVFGAGFLGGPIAGPLIAGGVKTLMARYIDHKSWDEAAEQGVVAGIGAIGGGVGGALVGGVIKKMAAKKLEGLAGKIAFTGMRGKKFLNAQTGARVTVKTARQRVLDGKATSWGLRGVTRLGVGAGAAIADRMFNGISELPVKIIT
ncbi:hypothetical protein [Nocardia sp. NPDC005998]|uniref:hypothetical protein n=1 Tax=Nocardia sp. NPDC005998 TaxID=3156894 RepID=UPI0033BDBB19